MNFWNYFRAKRSLALVFVSISMLMAVAAVACSNSGNAAGPYGGSATSTPAGGVSYSGAAKPAVMPATQPTASAAAPLAIKTAQGALGAFLTGPNGKTLYFFAKDAAGMSNCSGQCLENWPALTVPADLKPTAADGITGALASFTRADDGTRQLTYNGRPLYFFAGDSLPGDTHGDGIGGVWSIARP